MAPGTAPWASQSPCCRRSSLSPSTRSSPGSPGTGAEVRRVRSSKSTPEWGRRKLLAMLATGAIGIAATLVGIGFAVYYSVGTPSAIKAPDATARAQAPDPSGTDDAAALPGPLTTKQFGEI